MIFLGKALFSNYKMTISFLTKKHVATLKICENLLSRYI